MKLKDWRKRLTDVLVALMIIAMILNIWSFSKREKLNQQYQELIEQRTKLSDEYFKSWDNLHESYSELNALYIERLESLNHHISQLREVVGKSNSLFP